MELEVVVGTYDSRIIGYSLDLQQKPEDQALRKKYHENSHVGCVRCIASNGRYLASGGTDESIKLYDMRKHTDVGTLQHHEGSISCLCFYKNSRLLSASEDGTICVWRCGEDWELLHTLTGHKYAVTGLSVHPTGGLALSVGKDRTVRTWNLSTGLAAFTLRLPKAAELVLWSPTGDQYVLAVASTLMVYSVESGECTVVIEVGKKINSVIFIQDAAVAVASDKRAIELYSVTSGQLLASLEGHTSRVKGLGLSADNRLLFSASSDGNIRAWRLTESWEKCMCISEVETGARLTCITAVPLKQKRVQQVSESRTRTESEVKETLAAKTEGVEETGKNLDSVKKLNSAKKSNASRKSKKRTLETDVKTVKKKKSKFVA